MKRLMIIWVALCFSEAKAVVINAVDEETKGSLTHSHIEGSGEDKKAHAPVFDVVSLSSHQEEPKSSILFVGNDASTAPGSSAPGANTPGGGVPRIGEEFLNSLPAAEVPWWEKLWQAVEAFFS